MSAGPSGSGWPSPFNDPNLNFGSFNPSESPSTSNWVQHESFVMIGAGGSEMDVVEEDASGGYLPPNPAIEPPPSLFIPEDDEEDDEDDSDVSSPRRPSTSTSLGPGRRNRSESRASAHSAGPHSSPDRSLAQRRASTVGAEEGMGGQTRKKRNRPSTGRAPGRPKDDLISKLAVMKEDTGRLHCIAERCTQTWSSRTPLRIKHHASICPHLPIATRTLAAEAYDHAKRKAVERKAIKEGVSFVDQSEGEGTSRGVGVASAGGMEVEPEARRSEVASVPPPSQDASTSSGPRSASAGPSIAPPRLPFMPPPDVDTSSVPSDYAHPVHVNDNIFPGPQVHPLPMFPLPSFDGHRMPPPPLLQQTTNSPATSTSSNGSLGALLNASYVPNTQRYPSLGPSFLPTPNRAFFKSPTAAVVAPLEPSPAAPRPLTVPKTAPQRPLYRIVTSKAFDSVERTWMQDMVFTIDTTTGLILSVRSIESFGLAPDAQDVSVLEGVPSMDARRLTILPGFIDAHVHMFLHPYAETPWQQQVLSESVVERTIRAVGHARKTLMAGYTTVRDLGSEGALDSDIHLKQSLAPPLSLSPAPRLFVASRAIVSTGSYGPRTQKWDDSGHELISEVVGAEVADGPDEVRKVVRRQLGRGADWIKVYADYPTRASSTPFSPRLASTNHPCFTLQELKVAVETATAGGVKVAAHATRADTIRDCVAAGVSTIEHGYDADRQAFEAMKENGVLWVPTLAAYHGLITLLESQISTTQATFNLTGTKESETVHREKLKELRLAEDRWERMKRAFKLGLEVGVKIACGGDTGVFAHGDNSLELQRMVSLGAPITSVLSWCTQGGWESVRPRVFDGPSGAAHLARWSTFANERSARLSLHGTQPNWFVPLGPREADGLNEQPLGRLEAGFAADLVGLQGDVESNFAAAVGPGGVKLVVKAAKVVQLEGKEI